MSKKTFTYFALVIENKHLGVAKKIKNTVLASNNLGFDGKALFFDTNFRGLISFIIAFTKNKSNILYIRFSDLAFPFLFPILCIKRLFGQTIIVDVPTPRCVGIKELDMMIKNPIKRNLRKIWNYLSSTWIFFPVKRVVQYADEDLWFSLGIKNKTIKIGNGINIDNKLPIAKENSDKKTLNLIAVAQLADWHGYDRLIKAISKLDKDFKIRLKIVGDGYILSYLKNLTIELNLEDKITFTGSLFDRDLDNAFDEMDIGVSSLGLYRKGLSEASDLKTREYLARGLCTIGVGKDPDFDENSKYRFVVSNSDSIDDIVNLLIELKNINLPNRQEVRNYAIENFTFEKKLIKILKN